MRSLHCDACGGLVRGLLTPSPLQEVDDDDEFSFIGSPGPDEETELEGPAENKVGHWCEHEL